MASKNRTTERQAIGIIRVSRVSGREGESFASPGEQRHRIETECERDGLALLDVIPEMDVSGGTPLASREGLRRAVERIEAGEAQVLVAAYFDRLCRSLKVQGELIERVEAAGGQVLAVDVGQVTNGSAGQWLSGTLLGAVNEYQRRTTTERTAGAQARAVARGATPFARIPLGYTRENGTLTVNLDEVPIVREAFKMRAEGAPLMAIRKMLQTHGVERSHRGVQVMLANRIYLGELHFGKLVNLTACEAIIDRDLFDRVQRMIIPRGPQPESRRLLARLGVLRCGSCGARLSTMKMPQQGTDYAIYRCASTSDCEHHMSISAVIAEETIVEHVRRVLADAEGRASAEDGAKQAEGDLATAQDALDAAVRAFDGLGDVESARERLAELKAAVDAARARVDEMSTSAPVISVNAARDWDRLTTDEQRALIRATIKSAVVGPGRGAGRITITTA